MSAAAQLEYVGVIARPHGLDGTMVLSDAISLGSGIGSGTLVEVGFSRDFTKQFAVESFSQNDHRTTLKLREITSAEAVERLVDHAVFVSPQALGLGSADRYRIGDIEGCQVVDESGRSIGLVTEVWILPANDVWVVTTPSASTIPLPVIDDVIKSVDLERRVITAHLLDGLESVDKHEEVEPDA